MTTTQDAPRVIWIAWQRHRRSVELSRWLGVPSFLWSSRTPRFIKHPLFAWRTVRLLASERPDAVVVQNPSIVLTTLAYMLRPLLGYRLIVDAHNGGVIPDHPLGRIFQSIYRFAQRQADLTVVTNEALAWRVRANGGRPFVLPDRLPEVPDVEPAKLNGSGQHIVLISSPGRDEPLDDVLSAADKLDDDARIFITGSRGPTLPIRGGKVARNVECTGFLPEEEFWRVLKAADVIMDLTTREDCLVCGAYEAVAVGKPLILSDTEALRSYFSKGALYTRNDARSILEAIRQAARERLRLAEESVSLRGELEQRWTIRGEEFRRRLFESPPSGNAGGETSRETR